MNNQLKIFNNKKEHEARLIAKQQVDEYSYYDVILKNDSLVTISQIANDYGMSRRALNAKLHELGVQYKLGLTWLLYSQYQNLGWTYSDVIDINFNDGTREKTLYTRFTQKGRLGLYELLKRNGILPLIEKEN